MTELCLTIDPGKTSGYCLSVITGDIVYVHYDQAEWIEAGLYGVLEQTQPDHLIYESFEFRQYRLGVDLTPVRLIGVMNCWVQLHDYEELSVQNPATGKAYFVDEKLKEMDLYIPGKEHGRDACCHF